MKAQFLTWRWILDLILIWALVRCLEVSKTNKSFRLSDSQHHSNRETGQQAYRENSNAIQSIQRYCPFQSISYDAQEDNIRISVKKVVQWGGMGLVVDERFGQLSKWYRFNNSCQSVRFSWLWHQCLFFKIWKLAFIPYIGCFFLMLRPKNKQV